MKVSADGRAAITSREGLRLKAYKDSAGVWTIGVGHTGRMTLPKVAPGMTITSDQADQYLSADLAPVEAALNNVLKVEVSQNQFDALASFLFNVGIGWAGVNGHTVASIFTRINSWDMAGAAEAFDLFHKPAAIITRRNSEKAQFQTPDGTAPAPKAPSQAQEKDMASQIKPVQQAHTTSVNFIAGLENIASNIVTQLESAVKVVVSPNNDVTLQQGTSSTSGSIFGSISDAQSAISELQEVITDIQAKKWDEVPEDVLLLLKTIFSILSRFGINVPVVSSLIALIPDLPPVTATSTAPAASS